MRNVLARLVPWISKGDQPAGMLARFKAHIVDGGGVETHALAPGDSAMRVFGKAGALEPPLPFLQLQLLITTSNALRQNIEALATNVDGFGWRPEPTLDLFGTDAVEVVREYHAMRGKDLDDEEAAKITKRWRLEAEQERDRMIHFFEFIDPQGTFTELRKKRRFDYEGLGNAAWEVVRNKVGDLAVMSHVPFVSMRMLPLDEKSITVEIPHKTDPITIAKAEVRRRFRRFIQVTDNITIWFKEFGDPRLFSAETGHEYADKETLQREEPTARVATEILHFPLHAPNESYGMPRWIGTLPEVIGSRLTGEVNVDYFENKSVPPLAILISGGRVTGDTLSTIRDHLKNLKGKENYHGVLLIEAVSEGDAKNAGTPKIQLKPLTDAQIQDALFQRYDQNNIQKIGSAFRIPGLLRGESKELNRATAEVARAFAEEQVFQPERDAFDAVINRKILPRLGIRFWEFRTKAPPRRDPVTLTTILTQLVANGVVMAEEARKFVPDILGRELPPRDEPFLKKPLKLTLAEERTRARQVGNIKGDLTTENLAADGGLLLPEQQPVKGPGANGAEERRRRRRHLEQLAEDAVTVRQIMAAKELREDLGQIPADALAEMIHGDGSRDSGPTSDAS